MLIHVSGVVRTAQDIKEQQRINTCGVKDAYSQYVRWKHHTKLDKSLPLRPLMWYPKVGDGMQCHGFTLSSLMNIDDAVIHRVKHSMFLPCLDTLVVNEYSYDHLHIGTDLHVFSLV